MKSKLNENIGMSVSIAVVNTVQKQNEVTENEIKSEKCSNGKMNSKLNQNIGMSVSIAVVNTVQK